MDCVEDASRQGPGESRRSEATCLCGTFDKAEVVFIAETPDALEAHNEDSRFKTVCPAPRKEKSKRSQVTLPP